MKGFVGVALGVALGTLAFWLIISSVAHKPLLELISQSHALFLNEPLAEDKISKADTESLERLIKRGRVTTLDNLVGNVISYFSIIVTTLLGFLALVGALAFIYVRHASYAHAEEAAKGFIKEQFASHLEKKVYHDQVNDSVRELLSPRLNEFTTTMDDIGKYMETLSNLEDGINNKLDDFDLEVNHKRAELERLVAIVSDVVARLDRQEESGEDLELGSGDRG